MIHGTVSVEKSYISRHSETNSKTNAGISFKTFLKAKGGDVSGSTSTSTEFKQNSNLEVSCFGGSASVACGNVDIPTWAPTVEGNPHLLSGESLVLSDQIGDETVRTGLEIAICRYVLSVAKIGNFFLCLLLLNLDIIFSGSSVWNTCRI